MGQTLTCVVNNATEVPTNESFVDEELDISQEDLDFILGVGATLLSAVSVALGTILQKLAHNRNMQKSPEKRSREFAGLLMTPMWLLGLSLMIFLQLPLAMVAYTLTAQSLVVPLAAGSTIVFDQLLAPCLLHEKLSSREILATFLVVVGIALVTTANVGNVKQYSACELLDSWTNGGFIAAVIALVALILLSVVLVHCPPKNFMRDAVELSRPVSFCIIAGGSGAIMDILLKAAGEFAQGSAGSNAWETIHPYYHIVIVPFLAFAMISYINQGLQAYDAIIFLPLYNCVYIILATCYGAVFFQEFNHFDTTSFVSFFGGVALTLVGITIMSLFSLKQKRLEEEEEEETEEDRPQVEQGDEESAIVPGSVAPISSAGSMSSLPTDDTEKPLSAPTLVVHSSHGSLAASRDEEVALQPERYRISHFKSRSEPLQDNRRTTPVGSDISAPPMEGRRRFRLRRPRMARPKVANLMTPAFGSLSARNLMIDDELEEEE